MGDLYSDNDPDYRATRLQSGVPPPSSRDHAHLRQHQRQPYNQQRHNTDLSRYNPSLQRSAHSYQQNRQRQDQAYQPHHQAQRFTPYGHQSVPQNLHRSHRQQQEQQASYPSEGRDHNERQQHHYDRQSTHKAAAHPSQHKMKQVDLRTSTDFLACKNRLSIDDIVEKIALNSEDISNIDYDVFSSSMLVQAMNEARSKMSQVPKEILSRARSKSNPFEKLGNSIFMNRAAVKLAALDATFGLTQKEDATSTFTFADLCGGPGGFTEYLLWRIHSWGETAHGYGITLKSTEHDEVNWHLEKFKQPAPEGCFSIVHGVDGTGDLYKEVNIREFEAAIMKEQNQGVDLVVADGGFDFSGEESQQEIVAYQLILCEITTMLTCLKQGGHFVCKFFDMLSRSTASLVWLLYQLFDEVCITKPLSSRPANAERYLVCRGLVYERPKTLITKLMQLMQQAFGDANKLKAFSLIDKRDLEKDEEFIDYVKMRNMKFAMKQTEALEQMYQYTQNPDMPPMYEQEQIRRHLLNEWRLPVQI